jgi:hypothetical protein
MANGTVAASQIEMLSQSGTGITTIVPPATNTNRAITLPDAAGTIQVSGNPISGTTGTFTGLVDISAAGAGQIKFPATQNASANANTLDDYEEGTFTPTITAATGSYTSVTNISGIYTKIGNCVSVAVSFQLSNVGTGTGNAQINGMPFNGLANRYAGPAREIAVNGQSGSVYFNSNTTLLLASATAAASTASAYWLASITYQI